MSAWQVTISFGGMTASLSAILFYQALDILKENKPIFFVFLLNAALILKKLLFDKAMLLTPHQFPYCWLC
ncbi:unnamed protein product [Tenebrio molitor]|jgi:hypothetical protein|nr:unnamed protein product [Tenebrio molitor]